MTRLVFPTYTGRHDRRPIVRRRQTADSPLNRYRRGDFTPLLAWLRANVHGKGSLVSTRDLLSQATGRPLEAAPFKAHLRARYLG
jgi:carboxypeptidase Taq